MDRNMESYSTKSFIALKGIVVRGTYTEPMYDSAPCLGDYSFAKTDKINPFEIFTLMQDREDWDWKASGEYKNFDEDGVSCYHGYFQAYINMETLEGACIDLSVVENSVAEEFLKIREKYYKKMEQRDDAMLDKARTEEYLDSLACDDSENAKLQEQLKLADEKLSCLDNEIQMIENQLFQYFPDRGIKPLVIERKER